MAKAKSSPFQVSPGVRKRQGDEFDNYSRDFVGYSKGYWDKGNPTINFTVGRYGFNNSVSATIFDYLNSCGDIPTEFAKEAIVRFEENLRQVGVLDKVIQHTTMKSIATAVASKAIDKNPIVKMLDVAQSCADFAGRKFVKMHAEHDNTHFNWHPPTSSKGAVSYASYALAAWHKKPKWGPAYILGRESSKKLKSTTGKEFNPFGW